MAKNLEISILLDYYGQMLTEKQLEVAQLYYNEDLSLAEIAQFANITRQGVRDVIVRAEAVLTELEDKTGLIKRFHTMQTQLEQVRQNAQRVAELAAGYDNEELERLARQDVAAARGALEDILSNYQGFRRCVVILVFDAYKVRGGAREVEQYHNLYVVYTREAETADMYIERATHELAKEHRTRVVSSDGAEQIIVMGHGALRVSARAFEEEVRAVEKEIREFLGE